MRKKTKLQGILLSGAAAISISFASAVSAGPLATIGGAGNNISWAPTNSNYGIKLNLAHPDGTVTSHTYSPGEAPSASGLEDGLYTYELVAIPNILPRVRNAASDKAQRMARNVQSGAFTIKGGSLVPPNLAE